MPVAFHASCLSEPHVVLKLSKHFTVGLGSDVLVVQQRTPAACVGLCFVIGGRAGLFTEMGRITKAC